MLLEAGFEEYREGMLRAMTVFCRDGHAAEDAVQHAFMQGLGNRPLLEGMPDKAMRAWLYTAARNYLIDLARRRRNLVVGLADDTPAPQPDPTDQVLARQLMDRLPEELAQVVWMKYYAGMTSAQMGTALGLPAATVRTRLRRAMALMGKMVKET